MTGLEGKRILVVDDDLDCRSVLSHLLAVAGGDVRCAGSAAEALALVPQFRPEVLVSDLSMPGEDGISLMRKVRSLEPDLGLHVAAIAISGLPSHEAEARSLAAGFDAFVRKPIDPDLVFATILDLPLEG